MGRTGSPLAAWLLAAAVLASGVAAAVGPGAAGPPQSGGESAPLDVRVEPSSQVVDSGAPASFAIAVSNPEAAGPRSAFLTVGVSQSATSPERRAGAVSPVFVDGADLLLVEPLTLQPGEREYLAVPVPPDADPGEYEVNATVGYFAGGVHRTASDAARLTVESCRSLSGWLGCNASWLLPLLSLFVAILSFFGYRRVRAGLRTVDGVRVGTDERP